MGIRRPDLFHILSPVLCVVNFFVLALSARGYAIYGRLIATNLFRNDETAARNAH